MLGEGLFDIVSRSSASYPNVQPYVTPTLPFSCGSSDTKDFGLPNSRYGLAPRNPTWPTCSQSDVVPSSGIEETFFSKRYAPCKILHLDSIASGIATKPSQLGICTPP